MRLGWVYGAPALLLGLGLVAGCDSQQLSNFAAHRVGVRSDVPLVRRPYDAAMREACGEPSATSASELIRQPYLQDVRSDSLQLLWTAASETPYRVHVTSPQGEPVLSLDSRVDGAARPRNAYQHVARLSGLQPAQTYCYSLETPAGTPMATGAGFRTAPAPDSEAATSFVVFGDAGSGSRGQSAVFEQLQSVPFDLVLITGDVAYDSGTRAQFERNFFHVYGPMLKSVPVFPVAGNHDYRTDDGAPFREVFALPENGAPEGRERWYSFDWGDVHFVALDSERINETQARWLEQDLAQNDRPWTVAFTHRAPYSSGIHGSSLEVRSMFGEILQSHGVQLVLAGHDHHYERTVPIDGTTYVVTGGGGHSSRGVGESAFTAFSVDALHFVHVTVAGSELRLYAIDATGEEFDFARIVRD